MNWQLKAAELKLLHFFKLSKQKTLHTHHNSLCSVNNFWFIGTGTG